MEIREATEADIPNIVALLKLALGEQLMPKSERYWRWKHFENPFGKSPVLLSIENNEITGVRAFMRWEWLHLEGHIYKAVRAVDTATHPAYQGRGTFKKLTLALVDYCRRHEDHFVFNTPNSQSKPGYLKMGWLEAGKLPVRINFFQPFKLLVNYAQRRDIPPIEVHNNSLKYYLQHNKLGQLLDEHNRQANAVKTNYSAAYLSWRYETVPVETYVAIGEEDANKITGLIIGRLKRTRFGRELRITDCFLAGDSGTKRLQRKLRDVKREWGVDYITISGLQNSGLLKTFSYLNFSAALGPAVTVRSLSLADLNELKNFNQWAPSLGDLELF